MKATILKFRRPPFQAPFIAIILLLTQVVLVSAQPSQEVEGLVNWSDEGMVVFVSDVGLSSESPQSERVEAVLYRRIGTDSDFEEISRLQLPATVDEMNQRVDEQFLNYLMEETESETRGELLNYIRSNPAVENYGFTGFQKDLWRLLGTAYIDLETNSLEKGQTVTYRIRYVLTGGEQPEAYLQDSDTVGSSPTILRPQGIDRLERDSLVSATWAAPIQGSEDAFFADVYMKTGDQENYSLLEDQVFARRGSADSLIVYQYERQAVPETAYSFYIRPMDLVGNPGPVSDTLTVLSVDFENLPLVRNASSKDTTSGIHLSWDPVTPKPYLTGIEIRRSRDARRDFITLDTLNIEETEYLDTQLVPNKTYYYEFRIVTVRPSSDMPSAITSASFRNSMTKPSPPYGLTARREGGDIRLNWKPVAEPDIFGYYIYRGTSRSDSMAVVSRAIKDTTTFLDQDELLHGRTNYVYAVKAVNYSDLESGLSNTVVIRPDRIVRPPAPEGIEGYAEQKRVRLFWADQTDRDPSVEGYHVYRSSSSVSAYPDSMAASVQADAAGIERLTEQMVTTAAYDDASVESGTGYTYWVSTVDVFGVESTLSNPATFTPPLPPLLPPGRVSARTVSEGIEVMWNKTRQENATGYHIYRRAAGSESAERIGEAGLEQSRMLDPNVNSGELYWYSVTVIADQRESEPSSEKSVRAN